VTKPFSLGQIDVILRRVQDRDALELENRRLLQRLEALDGSGAPPTSYQPASALAAGRLGQLEVRLDAIETTLRDVLEELRRQGR
jgi:hypothetical protein